MIGKGINKMEVGRYSRRVEKLLDYLSKKYTTERQEIDALFNETITRDKERRCKIALEYGRYSVCNLILNDDRSCPYHEHRKVDFLRRCSFVNDYGNRCWKSIDGKNAHNLDVIYCNTHVNHLNIISQIGQANSVEQITLKRMGNNIVIEGTTFVLSDDMTSIIGYVFLSDDGTIQFKSSHKEGMEHTASMYRLQINTEE